MHNRRRPNRLTGSGLGGIFVWKHRGKTMRYLMLGSAAILLSGCSFLGSNSTNAENKYSAQASQYGQHQTAQATAGTRCHTGNCLARWNLEGGFGTVFPVSKNIVTSSRTNDVAGREFNSVSFGDAYESGIRAELGGSYALAPNTKVSVLGHYEQALSDGVQDLGTIDGQQLTGALTDYRSYGAEVGLRQYFQPTKVPVLHSIRPYVEARAGVALVEGIDLTNQALDGVAVAQSVSPLYEDSWVGTAAGLIGVETPVARYTTIGLETGVRYQTGLESDTSVLAAGTDLSGLNNNRGRVSIPLTLRGRYRF